jgi:hypothetical protein
MPKKLLKAVLVIGLILLPVTLFAWETYNIYDEHGHYKGYIR